MTECSVADDADGDGHSALECGGADCDDADGNRFPGNPEVCDAEGHDEDCDMSTFGGLDVDGDGHDSALCCNTANDGSLVCGEDCNDAVRNVHPDASEVCDGRDNDCDGAVDEEVQVEGFLDADGDQHGDPSMPATGCAGQANLSPIGDDCDDDVASTHPGQLEACNGVDDDCDGSTDEGTGAAVPWYPDTDGDGFGDAAGPTVESCLRPPAHSLLATDCNDDDPLQHPGAAERCNGLDDNCNGLADYSFGDGDFEDDDGDGYADAACADVDGDCNDAHPDVHPDAPELADGLDNDCDGVSDDTCVTTTWYLDADGDGWGDDDAATMESCDLVPGYATRGGDCNDGEGSQNQSQPEVCNGVDDDCDGAIDEQAELFCYLDNALAACSEGSCSVRLCARDFEDCDTTDSTGCEVDTRSHALHCGTCGTICFDGPRGAGTCSDGACGLDCVMGYADCDGTLDNGCEVDLFEDILHCGACTGSVCPTRPHAGPACADGICGLGCDPGWADCDGVLDNGCEVETNVDRANCGACSRTCPAISDACVAGSCQAPPFVSDGTLGDVVYDVNTRLAAGVHHYDSLTIEAGVTILARGAGVLDLRATGDVLIEGTIDVSGGGGGYATAVSCTTEVASGGGGATGTGRSGPSTDIDRAACAPAGPGGQGLSGSTATGTCGLGGSFGGGGGGFQSGGGGGGGFAGGGGGGGGSASWSGATGASVSPASGGAGGVYTGGTPAGGGGGEPGSGAYAGASGSLQTRVTFGAGGGGGSIGADAIADLAVSTTFQPGSGGGGGGGRDCGAAGGGGGGGGGALRITTGGRITVTSSGALRSAGGNGGSVAGYGGGPGGGGSGGVIHLIAPDVVVNGTITTAGGSPGSAEFGTAGAGGLGRVAVSSLPGRCTLGGSFTPPLVAGCAATAPAVPARTYVSVFPD